VTKRLTMCVAAALVAILLPSVAWAGMPAPMVLTDIARLRVEAISFFLAIFIACAAAVKLLWNRVLCASFPQLPRLNFWRALGLTALWGLLFLVVLTMISGGRELMTPGAWDRQGATYKLHEQTP
jgi:H+/Cl- antiporter ClcA